ncbi:hypothetical protein [Oceanicoccus sp. KOV_DT_Chl]|uniref:hypothetical protein n=1 Tax=Oceanicoccus sp. KOV_DT_Chl TaxID=1904639 RepID=UPI000C7C6B87|nr:hypothetical protein [Oceanicoccus sp. KOV_DT_Chl]
MTRKVINQVKGSAILLLFMGVLFSMPIVAVGYSVHGPDLAILAALLVVVLVFLGPLAFLFASTVATDVGLAIIAIVGVAIFLGWIKALRREGGHYVPYLPVMAWALMGRIFAYRYFLHTQQHNNKGHRINAMAFCSLVA